ncbi:MAG TPA: hypothetical protein VHR66_29725 [Gemmataceae bacterium]|jgi:hypothetical protein|nr:hypothetical protein [Gemmataceae bacterium]
MPTNDVSLAFHLALIAGNPNQDGPWLDYANAQQKAGDVEQAETIRAFLPQLREAVAAGRPPADALVTVTTPTTPKRAFTTEIVTNNQGEPKKDSSANGWYVLATLVGVGFTLVPTVNRFAEHENERDEEKQQ